MNRFAQVLIMLLVVSIALVGCGRRNPAPTPTVPPAQPTATPAAPAAATTAPAQQQPTAAAPTATTAAPTATPAPTTGGTLEGLDTSQLTGLETFNSYRSRYNADLDGVRDGAQVTQTIQVTLERNREQNAVYSRTTGSESTEGSQMETIEIIQIGNQRWANFSGTWGPLGTTELAVTDDLALAIGSLISGTTQLRNVGVETVNGIRATHYQFGLESMPAETQAEMGQIDTFAADLWIATENPFIVKFQFVMEGPALDMGGDEPLAGRANLLYEVYDFNEPITITEPEVGPPMLNGFAEGELPLPDDAEIEASMTDYLGYTTGQSIADLTTLYREQLAALGWTEEADPLVSDTFVAIDFTKDNISLSLSIGAAEEEGKARVSIFTSAATTTDGN